MAPVRANVPRRRVVRLAGQLSVGLALVPGPGALDGAVAAESATAVQSDATAQSAAPRTDIVICSASRRGESDSLVLRLRDVHIAEVFRALHELTGEGFVVDGNVGGRASAEIAAQGNGGTSPTSAVSSTWDRPASDCSMAEWRPSTGRA